MIKRNHAWRLTFEEVNRVSFSRPHVHVRVHALFGEAVPADLQRDRVAVACSVVSVLIQPVPAVPHEIGVKADDHLPVGRLLFPDPIKHGAESSFTAPFDRTEADVTISSAQTIQI